MPTGKRTGRYAKIRRSDGRRLGMNRRKFVQAVGGCGRQHAGSRPSSAGSSSGRGGAWGQETERNLCARQEPGIGSLSCYGADIFQTPNIDRLAEGGMRFTHCYTSPLTGPSRAVMLTGRYPLRTGATNAEAMGHAANGASRRAVRMRIRRVLASHRQRVLKHAER